MFKKNIKYITFILGVTITIVLHSCIDRIDLNIPSGQEKIVIEGLITNEPGPYLVKISRSTPVFEDPDNRPDPSVYGAKVFVSDDSGFETELIEVGGGVYQTNDINFVGEIGKTYTLSATINEKTYKSTSEVLKPVSDLQDLYFEVREDQYINENNVELTRYFLDVFVDIMNDTDEPQNIRFDWRGVYEFETNPKDRTRAEGFGRVPDPPLCSGWVIGSFGLTQVASCECCRCWGKIFSPTVMADQVSPGNFKKRLRVASVLIDPFQFQKKVQIKVHHYSVSSKAYNFWNLMEEQQNITGGIFDAPLGKVRGNITNINNAEEEVLGYFGASAVKENSIFVNSNTDIGSRISEIDNSIYTIPCDEWDAPNSTTERPSDW